MKKEKTAQSAASAEAQLRVAKSVVGVAEREVESARAKARHAKAQFKTAKKAAKQARKAAKAAKAKLRAARKSLKKLQACGVQPIEKKAVASKSAPVKPKVARAPKTATAKSGRSTTPRRRKSTSKIRARKSKPEGEEVASISPVPAEAILPTQAPQFESADSSAGAAALLPAEPPPA